MESIQFPLYKIKLPLCHSKPYRYV